MGFDSATLAKCSSSSTEFAKKPVRKISGNIKLFGTVNGAGIGNSNSDFFWFVLVLCLILVRHTPISIPVVSRHLFIALIKSTV